MEVCVGRRSRAGSSRKLHDAESKGRTKGRNLGDGEKANDRYEGGEYEDAKRGSTMGRLGKGFKRQGGARWGGVNMNPPPVVAKFSQHKYWYVRGVAGKAQPVFRKDLEAWAERRTTVAQTF